MATIIIAVGGVETATTWDGGQVVSNKTGKIRCCGTLNEAGQRQVGTQTAR